MKQLISLTAVFFFLFSSSLIRAQEISLKGGLTYSNVSSYWMGNDHSEQFSSKLGFQFGAMAKFHVAENYSLHTGAMLVQHKQKFTTNLEENDEWRSYPNRWYLEIPVLFRREFNLDGITFFGEIGPYAGIGVFINENYEHYVDHELVHEGSFYAEWGSDESDTKRFDAGLNVGIGIELKKLELGVSYEHGFFNIENADYLESKNRAFLLSCSYPIFSFNKTEK